MHCFLEINLISNGCFSYSVPSVFNLSSRKKDFQSLVSKLSQTFLESDDCQVLFNCVLALSSLASGKHDRSGDAKLKLQMMVVKLRERVLDVLSTKEEMIEGDDEPDEEKLLDVEHSLSVGLRRLAVLSKHLDVSLLLTDEDDKSQRDSQMESLCREVVKVVGKELSRRETSETKIPEIYEIKETSIHAMVASSISDALTFLLSTTAWRLRVALAEKEDDDNGSWHIVQGIRDGILKLLYMCYELYVAEEADCPDEQREFADIIQTHAGKVAGDLRSLFPRIWSESDSDMMRSLALIDGGRLIASHVRFLALREEVSFQIYVVEKDVC